MGNNKKRGAVLVIGGGIAGIEASLNLAESGFKVYLLEKAPSIGGHMPQLDKTFPTNDCAMCILAPKLVEVGRHPNIELITHAELDEIKGIQGDFEVSILSKARYVDIKRCTGCGICISKCPIKVKDEYNQGFSTRSNIYILYPQAVPLAAIIDRENCLYFKDGKCRICEKVCKAEAINFKDKDKLITINVGSIILSPGYKVFNPEALSEYGYGRYRNVITSFELERILSPSGPFNGHLQRLSDSKEPKRIAFIQCVGSRNLQVKNDYCSSVCCTYAIKEAIVCREHIKGKIDVTIFYMDIRTYGKGFEESYNRALKEGVRFIKARVAEVKEIKGSSNLIIHYTDESGNISCLEVDLVVLSVGFKPPEGMEGLAYKLGIELNRYGFVKTKEFLPHKTTHPGIFVAGAFQGPKDISEVISQALAAVCEAGRFLTDVRGSLITKREYPQEIDIKGQPARIGVFICHCGINIASVVDVGDVEEYAKSLPNVVYVQRNIFTCSQDTQFQIKERIKEYGLNRIVVAACSPRTHELLFQDTLRAASLNPYLFEMVNIRDQDSWVHKDKPHQATKKAKSLLRMAVAKVAHLEPLGRQVFGVIKRCLVIGGGVTGLNSALAIAEQGFEVYLIEKEEELGGNLRAIYYTLKGEEDPQAYLKSLIERVKGEPKIKLFLSSEIIKASGYVGNYDIEVRDSKSGVFNLKCGTIIVATGAVEYKPEGIYLYGEDQRVITQRELEERIAKRSFNLQDNNPVVMIHCVGSRNEDRPYCSRVCCQQSIKNALRLKELKEDIEIFILHKDIRTYGFMEEFYTKARDLGVIFIRYLDEPKVTKREDELIVEVMDDVLNKRLEIRPGLIVLNPAIVPRDDNERLSKVLKVTLDGNGFFLEAHPKLRPLDFTSDGIFLAGSSHSPKLIEESIPQALGAAARAITILSKDGVEAGGAVSTIDQDRCVLCLTCMRICPYGVPIIEEGRAKIEAVKCHGCGTCTGECPAKAIQLLNYKDSQIFAGIEALLGEEYT